MDRGKEFACYSYVKGKLKIHFYFADPYSAWERGTNENNNGLLRKFYPKRINLALVSDYNLIESESVLFKQTCCQALRS